ncbi:MAG TPA: hypothetical protein VIB99_08070 [Candidatus Limnocylindrales bacterium]|jgi:hypothetical protein
MSAMVEPDRSDLRPQRFGHLNQRKVVDPLIEPIWVGERVLAHVETTGPRVIDGAPFVAIQNEDGELLDAYPDVTRGLADATRAISLVLDGYLTDRVNRGDEGAALTAVATPTSADMTRQLLMGGGRRHEELYQVDKSTPIDPAAPTTFVAVDVLMVDGEEIFDVPLLERKRVLESVIEENQFVRRGIYVRPPFDGWLISWRSIGFQTMAFKAANGRYRPGADNDGWAIARIPSR